MKKNYDMFFKKCFLSFALAVSFNVSAADKDVLRCNNNDNINRYNNLQDLIQNSSKLFLIHNLSIVSLCIGKEQEGMGHLQKAADAGFIGSVYLSGQPHINLLIYQYVRGVTIIQVKSKRSAIWKTDMDQYRFSSK